MVRMDDFGLFVDKCEIDEIEMFNQQRSRDVGYRRA